MLHLCFLIVFNHSKCQSLSAEADCPKILKWPKRRCFSIFRPFWTRCDRSHILKINTKWARAKLKITIIQNRTKTADSNLYLELVTRNKNIYKINEKEIYHNVIKLGFEHFECWIVISLQYNSLFISMYKSTKTPWEDKGKIYLKHIVNWTNLLVLVLDQLVIVLILNKHNKILIIDLMASSNNTIFVISEKNRKYGQIKYALP